MNEEPTFVKIEVTLFEHYIATVLNYKHPQYATFVQAIKEFQDWAMARPDSKSAVKEN